MKLNYSTLTLLKPSLLRCRSQTQLGLIANVARTNYAGPSESSRVTLVGPPVGDILVNQSYRAFRIRGVNNFEIRNIFVNNRISRFSGMILLPQEPGTNGPRPTRGTIANFTTTEMVGGFAAIQVHAAGQVRFENIRTVGGVGLRFESDIPSTPGITDITANFGSGDQAQLRPSTFRVLPPGRLPTILPQAAFTRQFRRNGSTAIGSPVGVIEDEGNYNVDIDINTLELNGFPRALRGNLVITEDTPDRNTEADSLGRLLGTRRSTAREIVLGR